MDLESRQKLFEEIIIGRVKDLQKSFSETKKEMRRMVSDSFGANTLKEEIAKLRQELSQNRPTLVIPQLSTPI